MFTAVICIGSLVNDLFGIKIVNPVSLFFLFWGFNFILTAIDFSVSSFTSSSAFSAGSGGKWKSKFSAYFQLLSFSSELL